MKSLPVYHVKFTDWPWIIALSASFEVRLTTGIWTTVIVTEALPDPALLVDVNV